MKRIASTVAVVIAVALASPGLAADDGKELFAKTCASCHGPDGKSKTTMGQKLGAKDLTTSGLDEAQMVAVITSGKPPKMMAYKDRLTPEQTKAIATFVKTALK